MNFSYVRSYYGVPAEIGRRVRVYGRLGTIVADRGHYIGVNFDEDKPNVVKNVHPTSEVAYLGLGNIREMTKAQERYARYRECAECFDSFLAFCRYEDQKLAK